jgi:short-subunit dehydrogenase
MQNRRILVTGASSGVGRELARELSARGATLALSARSEPRLHQLAAEIAAAGGGEPLVLPADLSKRGAAAELAERALESLGRVDVLVNNAGANLHGLQATAGESDDARGLFETNYWSPLSLIRKLVGPMRERGNGLVVNVTSMVQVSPFPGLGHYASSKAALALATQTLRMELRGSGVRAVEIVLGVVDTPGSFENRTLPGAEGWLDGGPIGTVQGAARTIVAALERGRRERVIYPRSIAIGYVLPGLARHFATRFARRVDLDAVVVRRTGSTGDELQRAQREQWERQH